MLTSRQMLDQCYWASRLYRTLEPDWGKRVRFALRSLFYLRASARWFRFLQGLRLSRPRAVVKELLQLPHRPYFDRRLTSEERVRLVMEHHHLCYELLGPAVGDLLATGRRLLLASIAGKRGIPLELAIAADGRFREGMLTVSLDANGKPLIVMSVTLAYVGGVRSIMVGCVQTTAENRLDQMRDITKELHGLQPRLLLVQVLRLLGRHLGIGCIEAISNRNHAFSALGYGRRRDSLKLAYDELWSMAGGEALGNGNYRIPVEVARRPVEAYPSKKRAEYQRRYALIDAIDSQITVRFGRPASVTRMRLDSAA